MKYTNHPLPPRRSKHTYWGVFKSHWVKNGQSHLHNFPRFHPTIKKQERILGVPRDWSPCKLSFCYGHVYSIEGKEMDHGMTQRCDTL
jgi:hypothetical protein